jgi:hypothetical protein
VPKFLVFSFAEDEEDDSRMGAVEDVVAKTQVTKLGTVKVGSGEESTGLWQVGLVGGRGLPPGIILGKQCKSCHSSQCNHVTAFKKSQGNEQADGEFPFQGPSPRNGLRWTPLTYK